MFDSAWLDPERSVADYNASIGGDASLEAFLQGAINRPLGEMPYAYTSYSAINYIREGFNKAPVTTPYEGYGAVLSTSQNELNTQIKIYPNPIEEGSFYINTLGVPFKTFEVFDVLGHKMFSVDNNTGEIPLEVNTKTLKPGIYLLKPKGASFSKKIIVK